MKVLLHTLMAIAMTLAVAVGGTAQQRPELVTQTGHTATVQAIAISPDSKYLASAGGDRIIIVWDIQRQKQLYSLKGHTAWIIALAFSPDGALLASGSRDGTVKTWNVSKGTKEEDISLQPYFVTSLAFSPLGDTLAISTTDKAVKRWDVTARKMMPELVGHDGAVTQVAFSPDGKYLASSSQDATLILWDLALGTPKFRKTYKDVPPLLFGPGEFQNPVELAIKLRDNEDGDALTNYIRARFSETTRNLLKGYAGSIPLPDDLQNALTIELNKVLQGESLFNESFFPLEQLSDEVRQLAARRPQGEDLIRLNRKLLASAYVREIGDNEKGRGVTSLAYGRDGTFVVCATADNVVSVWNLKNQDLTMFAPPQGYPLLNSDKIVELRVVFLAMRFGRGAYLAGSLALNFNHEVAFVDSFRLRLWNVKTKRETLSLEITNGVGSRAVTFNKECNLLAFNDGEDVVILDLLTKKRRELKGGFGAVNSVAFSGNGKWLLSSFGDTSDGWGDTSDIYEQDLLSVVAQVIGRELAYVQPEGLYARIKQGAGDDNTSEIEVFNPLNPTSPPRLLKGHKKPVISLAAHPTAPILMSCSEDGTIISWDVNTGEPLVVLQEAAELMAFSPKDGDLLATAGNKKINIWKTETLKKVTTISTKIDLRTLTFSPDGKIIAALGDGIDGTLNVWDVNGTLLQSFQFNTAPEGSKRNRDEQSVHSIVGTFRHYKTVSGSVAFSRDGSLIAAPEINPADSTHRIKIWNVKTGELVNTLRGHLDSIRSIAFASNKVLASGSWDETIKLWSVDQSEELATIVKINEDNWIIYRPDGRFETDVDLEGNETVHWAMRGDVLNPLPLDIFMRDYAEKDLFQRLMDCAETSCDTEFKQIRDLSELNIIQPKVAITGVSLPDANGEVSVTVEVSRNSGTIQRENGPKVSLTANVYDLRVFRDRQLIGVAPGDGAEKLQRLGASQSNSEADLKVWREASEIKLDPRTGKQTLSFKAKLPQGEDPTAIKFTAYAFNDDRVRSQTASYEWTAEQKAKLPKARPDVARRAYVISVGVNISHISDWNLNHGADDSYQFQKVIPEKLRQVGAYEIVSVELVSDLKDEHRIDDATKQNVKTVFDILAGRHVSAEAASAVPNAQRLRAATPDDLVLIMFSSHGYSGNDRDFYLFPSDATRADPNQTIPDLQSLISGEEMSIWLRDVDAAEIAIIIDACQSAAAVERFDFKPGPLGSRGLGQLAYDKGMMVLTATQADNGALEVDGEINQGLLSYALVQEGLVESMADLISSPAIGQDGKITLKEWLEFGKKRVARLYENVVDGKLKGVVWKKNGKPIRRGDPDPLASIQRASLFDYSRRSSEIVIAYSEPETGDTK